MSVYGYNGKILNIDLGTWKTEVHKEDEDFYRIYAGGGLMGAYFLLKNTPANIDSYDGKNALIFVSSIISGLDGPGLAQFSVVTKSPLSGGIAETKCEGSFARYLKGSGYDGIIITGRSKNPVYVLLEDGDIEFFDAEKMWGKDTLESSDYLEQEHGKDTSTAVIGPAGENLVRYASIITDRCNAVRRLGVGAVMGSKNLKAVVLKGLKLPQVYDRKKLNEIKKYFELNIANNKLSAWQKELPGFSAHIDLADADTAYLGVNNFNSNLFTHRKNYSRDNFLKYFKENKPCPGCSNDCIKLIYTDDDISKTLSSGMHQEVSVTLGPLIGNRNLELMLEMNRLCNLYGIDPVSLGFTISFAMDCFENRVIDLVDTEGIKLNFGNEEAIKNIFKKIVNREGFGEVLAEGTKIASEEIGKGSDHYAMNVKGVELAPFEPRSMTNLALGFATAPIGPRYDICEHDWDYDISAGWEHTLTRSRTLGIFERIPMELVSNLKVRNYLALNNIWSACDALNLCIFASSPTRVLELEKMTELIEAVTGWQSSSHELIRWGERRNTLMRIYNLREGLTKEDDKLPEKFFKDKIESGRFKGIRLDRDKFYECILTYYHMMGWDENGIPTEATLYKQLIEWTIPVVEKIKEVLLTT